MVKENKPQILPDFPQEFRSGIAEHEVFMSFLNDIDAEIWFNWWHEEGYKGFLEYHKHADKD